MASAPRLGLPLLLIQAGEDRLVSASASKAFFESAGSTDKTYREYPGLYHELLNEVEPERAKVFEQLSAWLTERIPNT